MQSRTTKIATAAVVIVIILVGINLFVGQSSKTGQAILTQQDIAKVEGHTSLERELTQILEMFIEDDADGLTKKLSSEEFESKVFAARCLGKIGDESTLPILEKLYLSSKIDLGEGQENPFAAAAEEIKKRLKGDRLKEEEKQAQAESAMSDVTNEPERIENQQPVLNGNQTQIGTLESADSTEKKSPFRPQKETVKGTRPTGKCSISGKVISEETGEPIGHAKVYLFYTNTFAALFIEVASDGTFDFNDIPIGSYSIRTIHTKGFQDAIYNPESKPGQHPQFSLVENEKRSILLKASPAYSISGKVLDENGNPLKDRLHWVLAWVEKDQDGSSAQYRIAKQTRVTVDGSYLLDNLDGRPVYVMAIDWKAQEKEDFYSPCYYPGTLSRDDAEQIFFDEEWSIEEADIYLQKKGELVLEGVVTDATTGEVIPKALVVVNHRDMLFDRVTAYTDDQGHYKIESLGAGEFSVNADASPWGFVRTRKIITIEPNIKSAELNFELNQGVTILGKIVDLNGNEVEIGSRAYGLVYKDNYPTPETSSWSGVRNKYYPECVFRREQVTFNPGEGDYQEEYMVFPTNSSFIVKGMLPGKIQFRFHPKNEEQAVLEILYQNEDILETGLDIEAGQEIKDVTIVIGAP